MNELIEWLNRNKIVHEAIDHEVINLPEFGKMFFEDTEKINSIFRLDKDGEYIFNSTENPDSLMEEDINYIVFKFGNNWYYTDLRQDFSLNILKYIGQRKSINNSIEFVNLGVHTPFELLNGSFSPSMWVKKAKYCGHKAIGICDKNTMAACYNLQKECLSAGINPVFGYSLTFDDGESKIGAKVYVQSQKGLQNLLRIQKAIMVDSEDRTISLFELKNRGEGNVLVLDKYSSYWIKENTAFVSDLLDVFDNVFYQVDFSEYKAEKIDIKVLQATKYYFDHLYESSEVGPILLCDCYYLDADDCKNKIILNKIAEGASHEQSDDQYYKDADQHYEAFVRLFDAEKWDIDEVFQECCDNTMFIASGAKARFENTRNFMPKYAMTPEEKDRYGNVRNMFNQLLEEGFQRLVPPDRHEKYRNQMEYEKYIIESTNNIDYLLVQHDVCNWSRKNGILVGCGRGSAAGSLLLYLLGITLVDPIKYGLIFERFLLPERAGLYPADTTIIGEDIEAKEYMEVKLEGSAVLKIDKDAQLIVKRDSDKEPVIIYADELQAGDDILFDNKDLLFTINELQHDTDR
jgi:DNA polymerase-3 subunit alpha